jgi:hypothetical protein
VVAFAVVLKLCGAKRPCGQVREKDLLERVFVLAKGRTPAAAHIAGLRAGVEFGVS